MKLKSLISYTVLASLLSLPLSALCADPVLAASGKSSVTTTDVQGDALRIPPEARKMTLANSDAVQQLANNLIIRRALADEAEAAGMAKDAAVQAAIRIARDRVLSDMLIAKIDAANKPTRQVTEALALTNYNANPKRFDLPEEIGASHILIKGDTPDARGKAITILAELKAGADFADLAKKHSQDPGSAQNGGSLGFFPLGQMVPQFEAALLQLKRPGEMSGVVESPFGFHIIKLDGRRAAGVRPFDQVKDVLIREAEAKILTEKRLDEVQRIQKTITLDRAAIENFAKSND